MPRSKKPRNLNQPFDDLLRNIRELMQGKDWNQSKLAQMSGLTNGAISSYMTGRTMPHMDAINKIAKAFDVPLHQLFLSDLDAETIVIRREKIQPTSRDIIDTLKRWEEVYRHAMRVPVDIRERILEEKEPELETWETLRKALKILPHQK